MFSVINSKTTAEKFLVEVNCPKEIQRQEIFGAFVLTRTVNTMLLSAINTVFSRGVTAAI